MHKKQRIVQDYPEWCISDAYIAHLFFISMQRSIVEATKAQIS